MELPDSVTFKVRLLSGSTTTITIFENRIECPLIPTIKIKDLNEILINNAEKERYKERSFALKSNKTYNFIAKEKVERNRILQEILKRLPSNDTHRVYLETIETMEDKQVLVLDHDAMVKDAMMEDDDDDGDMVKGFTQTNEVSENADDFHNVRRKTRIMSGYLEKMKAELEEERKKLTVETQRVATERQDIQRKYMLEMQEMQRQWDVERVKMKSDMNTMEDEKHELTRKLQVASMDHGMSSQVKDQFERDRQIVRRKNLELEEKRQKLENDARALEREKTKVEMDMQRFEDESIKIRVEKEQLEEQRRKLSDETFEIERVRSDMEFKLQRLKDDELRIQNAENDLKSKLQHADDHFAGSKVAQEELQAEQNKLKMEQDLARKHEQDLERQRLRLKEEMMEINNIRHDLSTQRSEFAESERKLHSEQAAFEVEKRNLINAEQKLRQGHEHLAASHHKMENDRKIFEEDSKRTQHDLEFVGAEHRKLDVMRMEINEKIRKMQKSEESLHEMQKQLEQQQLALQAVRLTNEADARNAQNAKSEMEAERDGINLKLRKHVDEVLEMEHATKKMNEEARKLQQSMNDLQILKDEIQKERDAVMVQKKDLEQDARQLKRSKQATREDFNHVKYQIHKLDAQRQRLQKDEEILKMDQEKLRGDQDKMKQDAKQMRKTQICLEINLKKSNEERKRLQALRDDLQKRKLAAFRRQMEIKWIRDDLKTERQKANQDLALSFQDAIRVHREMELLRLKLASGKVSCEDAVVEWNRVQTQSLSVTPRNFDENFGGNFGGNLEEEETSHFWKGLQRADPLATKPIFESKIQRVEREPVTSVLKTKPIYEPSPMRAMAEKRDQLYALKPEKSYQRTLESTQPQNEVNDRDRFNIRVV